MPVFATDARQKTPLLIGIHVAGNGVFGIAQPVYKTDVDAVLSVFGPQVTRNVDFESLN